MYISTANLEMEITGQKREWLVDTYAASAAVFT